MHPFHWPIRVYYEDTDSGGVVYYANYLKFMERARSEWLRSLDIGQDRLRTNEGIIFVVRAAHIEYLKPARFNDMLDVSVEVARCGRASLTFEQQVARRVTETPTAATRHAVLCCRGRIKIACVDSATMQPCAIPPLILAKFSVGDVS